MTKIRRGGYVFLTWVGDHTPRHVHIYRDGQFVAKWDLEARQVMAGVVNRRIRCLIQELEREGQL